MVTKVLTYLAITSLECAMLKLTRILVSITTFLADTTNQSSLVPPLGYPKSRKGYTILKGYKQVM